MENKFCLFSGRHDLPENRGAICTSFNFEFTKVEKSPLWDEMFALLVMGEDVELIVTGLTPALCEVLRVYRFLTVDAAKTSGANERHGYEHYPENWPGKLTLLHYNSATKEYQKQVF